jgi:hypothetical protein
MENVTILFGLSFGALLVGAVVLDRAVKARHPKFHGAFELGAWAIEIVLVLSMIAAAIHLLLTDRGL